MKSVFYVVIVYCLASFLFFTKSYAQNQAAQYCQARAKKVATTQYQSCMANVRQERVKKLKRQYQLKMQELKDYYESKIRDLQPPQKPTKRLKSRVRKVADIEGDSSRESHTHLPSESGQ